MEQSKNQQSKSPSTKPSITGAILSLLALASSGIAYGLTHADSRTKTEVTTALGTVDSGPVAEVASKSVTGVLSMPFIVITIVLAVIALLFLLVRIRRVKVSGLILSIIWIGVSVWAIMNAVGALDTLRATPVS